MLLPQGPAEGATEATPHAAAGQSQQAPGARIWKKQRECLSPWQAREGSWRGGSRGRRRHGPSASRHRTARWVQPAVAALRCCDTVLLATQQLKLQAGVSFYRPLTASPYKCNAAPAAGILMSGQSANSLVDLGRWLCRCADTETGLST